MAGYPSVCLSDRMNAVISKTIKATMLGLGEQIPDILKHNFHAKIIF